MKLQTLTINNFVRYAAEQTVSFEGKHNIFIYGQNYDVEGLDNNGSGKTLFAIDALSYALVGETSRNITVDELVTPNAEQCQLVLEGTHNGDTVIITRTHDRRTPSLTVSINGDTSLITKRTASLTNKALMEYLNLEGTPKEIANDLFNTICLTKDSVELFASNTYTSSDRFKFISRLLNTQKWETCSKKAREVTKNLKQERDALQQTTDYLRGEMKSADELYQELDNINTKKERTISVLNSLEDAYTAMKNLGSLYSEKESVVLSLKELRNEKKERLNTTQNNLRKIEKNLDVYHTAQSISPPEESLEYFDTEIDSVKQSIQSLEYEKESIKTQITEITQKIQNIKIGDTVICPVCNTKLLYKNKHLHTQTNRNKEKILQEMQQELEKYITQKQSIQETIDRSNSFLQKSLNKREELKDSIANYINAEITLETLGNVPEEYVEAQNVLDELKRSFNIKITTKEERLKTIESQIEEIDTSFNSLQEIEQEITTKKQELEQQNTTASRIQYQLEETEKKQVEIDRKKSEIKTVESQMEQYEYWIQGFMEVRRLIIESFLPQFNAEANTLIRQMGYPVTIDLTTLQESKSGNIREEFVVQIIDNYGQTRTIDNFSGGERKRIALVIAFALQRTLKQMRTGDFFEFIVFDEILDLLDTSGVEYFIQLIQNMSELKLFISHNKELSRFFNDMIRIEKKNGISYIKSEEKA